MLTYIQSKIAEIRNKRGEDSLRVALSNFSRTPGGQKRTVAPRNSIWPEGKTANPGRMG